MLRFRSFLSKISWTVLTVHYDTCFLFRWLKKQWGGILVKVLSQLSVYKTVHDADETCSEKEDDGTEERRRNVKSIMSDAACAEQEQVFRKAGQWRVWGHYQSRIEIPSCLYIWSRDANGNHVALDVFVWSKRNRFEPNVVYEDSHARMKKQAEKASSWKRKRAKIRLVCYFPTCIAIDENEFVTHRNSFAVITRAFGKVSFCW